MEILKTKGEPDRILMKNVVYKIDDLKQRCKYKNHKDKEECFYTTRFYKQTSSGKEAFDLPTFKTESGSRKFFLFPKKVTGDVVLNTDLEIERHGL